MGVVKAECKPTQNAEIETVSVKCASGVGYNDLEVHLLL